ncbi:MAG: NUDIX domain-containing protein, partial [bacterium]|nr:NUDIX domain-containing protein [bacterium]
LFQKIWVQGALLDCPTDPQYTYDLHGNAECFIVINHQLLAERHTLSGKLNLPGGMRKVGETAQCTAYRETLEEVGIKTRVGKLLYHHKNFKIFECQPLEPVDLNNLVVPDNMWPEVSDILLVDIFKEKQEDWRFKGRVALYQQFLK